MAVLTSQWEVYCIRMQKMWCNTEQRLKIWPSNRLVSCRRGIKMAAEPVSPRRSKLKTKVTLEINIMNLIKHLHRILEYIRNKFDHIYVRYIDNFGTNLVEFHTRTFFPTCTSQGSATKWPSEGKYFA
jgi:hypothetical protein